MNSIKFSIVTPVYNGEAFIARTIESVLDQTVPPYEYNIVDGGSTDRTVEICDSYREQFAEKGSGIRLSRRGIRAFTTG